MEKDKTYKPIGLNESLKFDKIKHAAHCLLWFDYKVLPKTSFGLMQVRSDGLIGFPGGFIDEKITSINDIVCGLNRELKEELNCDKFINLNDYCFTHYLEEKSKKILILHFFVKKLSKDEFENIELNFNKAQDYITECLGIFRIHLKEGQFLNNFLNSSTFCGNSKKQLLDSINILENNYEL